MRYKKIKRMEDKKNLKNRNGARVVGGLLLVAAGAALLIRNMGYFDLPYWLFSWPMILILVGIYSGVKHNFQNNGWIIMIAVGVFFLADRFIPNLKLEPAFWPLIIIGLGIVFIFRPGKKNWLPPGKDAGYDKWHAPLTNMPESSTYTGTNKSDFIKIESVFSGVNRTILSKNFQGGKISCVFGGAEIDLAQADITGTVLLKMDVVFGGVKLIVPANWAIQSDIDGIFQSVDDKRKYNASTGVDANKILLLKGSCVFGGIEVKSY